MLRLFLLKFLPRRLLPLLLLYEAYKFLTRLRGQSGPPARNVFDLDRDDRIIEGRATAIPASEDAIR